MPTVALAPGSLIAPGKLKINAKPDQWGGQGSVFFTPDGRYIVKIYHERKLRDTPEKTKERLRMLIRLGSSLGEDDQFLAWPLGVVERLGERPAVGCVSKRVPPSHVELYKLIFSPQDMAEQLEQGYRWVNYLKMARATAAALRTVHDKGIAVGDVSFKNVLANPETGEAVLVDLDSATVPGFVRPVVGGTPGFLAPELVQGLAQPSETSDRHSAAVLILWTLLFRNVMQPPVTACYAAEPEEDERLGWGKYACFSEHPKDRRHWFGRIGRPLYKRGALSYKCLTPKLQALTEKTLIQGLHHPDKRVAAREWFLALAEAYDALAPCRECKQSLLYPYWIRPVTARSCPFCGTRIQSPYPAVLELREERSKGHYVAVRSWVTYHGLPVYADVAVPGSLPPFAGRSSETIGQATWDPKARVHRLTNRSADAWRVVSGGGGLVDPGESVALRPGVVLDFGQGRRRAKVME